MGAPAVADPVPDDDENFDQWLADLREPATGSKDREGQLMREALLDAHRELPPESPSDETRRRAQKLIQELDARGLFAPTAPPWHQRLLEWLFPPLAPPLLEARSGQSSRSWRRWLPFLTLLAILAGALIWYLRR
jgi:hypothetical protein